MYLQENSRGPLQDSILVLAWRDWKIQNSTYPDAGNPDRQLSGSAWPFD